MSSGGRAAGCERETRGARGAQGAQGAPGRRGFLAGAGAALAACGLGSLLAGCDMRAAAKLDEQPLPPSPTNPVTWPLYAGNLPIDRGLLPERNATLQVVTVARRFSQRSLADFARQYQRYGCNASLTTFATMPQALAELARGRGRYDVFLGATTDVIGTLVGRKLVQPLNHHYFTNAGGVWPRFKDPYYDQGWRYTVPYTVYTTGLAWRKDLIDSDPYTSTAEWAFPWQAALRGKAAILDDYRESLALGLLAAGITDLNTSDPRLVDMAEQALAELAGLVHVRIDNNASAELAAGTVPLHHARSGDAAAAATQLRAGVPAEVLGYWFPPSGRGPVGSDTAVILRGARSPVLAHLFLNDLLNPAVALTNVRRTGYLQPISWLSPGRLIREGALPPNLISTAVLPTFFDGGLKELALPGPVDQLWLNAWSTLRRQV